MGIQTLISPVTGDLNISNSVKSENRENPSFQELLSSTSGRTKSDPAYTKHILKSQFPNISRVISENTSSVSNNFGEQEKAIEQYRNMSDWDKYKDDQLLSNPGGDDYYLEKKEVIKNSHEQDSLWGRITKDLSDSLANARNFVQDFFFGSKVCFRGADNQIMETTKRGLVGSIFDFFNSFGSALTFGLWRPNGEEEPQGLFERLTYSFSNIKRAIFGDIIEGVGSSVLNMGEDLALSLWNLVETIPDATIGNFDLGKKISTTIFDNGQVLIDYLTDIMPTGEAWMRVHAFDMTNIQNLELPLIYNIKLPETYSDDIRWQHIRNTPFRKVIETIGSIIADVVTIELLGDTKLFSEKTNDRH